MKLNHLLLFTCLAGGAWADPQEFDFKDPKGVNNAVFKLDAPLEAISGTASGISGTVTYDPAKPEATKGRIVIASDSLKVSNPMMQEHLRGDKWLDVAKYPAITFEPKDFKNVQIAGITTTADVTGVLTLKGVAKELTVPVKLTYLKDKLRVRVPGLEGDLLVLRTSFCINRSDFGIMASQLEERVSETIDITLSIAGAAARPAMAEKATPLSTVEARSAPVPSVPSPGE